MLLTLLSVLFVLIDNNLGRRDRRARQGIIKMESACRVTRSGLVMKMVLDVLAFLLWMKHQYFIRWYLLRKLGTVRILEMYLALK